MRRNEYIALAVALVVMAVVLGLLSKFGFIDFAQGLQILITFILVCITVIYVMRTADIADATRRQALATRQQAEASVKMAEEMKEQRVMASRPVIIQGAIYKEASWTDLEIQWIGIERSATSYFSHFEVYNVGSGPAIEVEISLLDKEGSPLESIRQTFLKADDPPIKFRPSNIANLEESTTYYLVCEYQSILSHGPQKTLYRTRLPFKPARSSKEDEIFLVAGELEFSEVSQKERIDAFSSRSKPK